MMTAVGRIATAVDLPVTADLRGGLRRRGQHGQSGHRRGHCWRHLEDQLKPLPDAVRAVEAAVTAGAKAGVPFVLNARTDAFLKAGDKDPEAVLADALERLGVARVSYGPWSQNVTLTCVGDIRRGCLARRRAAREHPQTELSRSAIARGTRPIGPVGFPKLVAARTEPR